MGLKGGCNSDFACNLCGNTESDDPYLPILVGKDHQVNIGLLPSRLRYPQVRGPDKRVSTVLLTTIISTKVTVYCFVHHWTVVSSFYALKACFLVLMFVLSDLIEFMHLCSHALCEVHEIHTCICVMTALREWSSSTGLIVS